mmetsp:Transcript_52735/g.98721  ORF Transcript_52735/g.98721 Transcript_52735/m.98721 type:complete len:221 (+) Transcript_52735:754-1416(+)
MQLLQVQFARAVRITFVEDPSQGVHDQGIGPLFVFLFLFGAGPGSGQGTLHHHADDGVHESQRTNTEVEAEDDQQQWLGRHQWCYQAGDPAVACGHLEERVGAARHAAPVVLKGPGGCREVKLLTASFQERHADEDAENPNHKDQHHTNPNERLERLRHRTNHDPELPQLLGCLPMLYRRANAHDPEARGHAQARLHADQGQDPDVQDPQQYQERVHTVG